MSRLNLATSDDTILPRLVRAAREQVEPKVRVVGVDAWAWSKDKGSELL